LPRSALEYRAWWSNDATKPHARGWLDEGWRASTLSMTERRLTFVRTNERDAAYIEFFSKLIRKLQETEDFPLRESSPQGANWMPLCGLPWGQNNAATINAAFARGRQFQINLYLDCGDKENNKAYFDHLFERRVEIEAAMGERLVWRNMESKRASKIAISTRGHILTDAGNSALVDWAARKAIDFYRVFLPQFQQDSPVLT
jgi:hypothetical protein